MDFYRQFVKSGDLVFDIGANIGNRTEPLLTLGAKVVAVEPQPMCINTLTSRFGKNPNFTLLPVGAGAEPGTATLHLATNHVTSSMSEEFISTMHFAGSEWSEEVQVDVTTLDSIIDRFGLPAFCKIDVEGFEVPVLQGLSRAIPAISLEYTPDLAETSARCLEMVAALGDYEFAYSEGESMEWSSHGWMKPAAALELARAAALPFGDFYARTT